MGFVAASAALALAGSTPAGSGEPWTVHDGKFFANHVFASAPQTTVNIPDDWVQATPRRTRRSRSLADFSPDLPAQAASLIHRLDLQHAARLPVPALLIQGTIAEKPPPSVTRT